MPSIGRAGASLTTPVIISGATSPAARAIARISPVRIDGMTAGRTTRHIVSNFVAPSASEASRIPRGIAASPSSAETITTGTVRSASVSDAQRMPPVPQVGVGSDSAKKSPVDRPADEVDEEAEAEDAVDDRRDAGQVVHGDPHGADDRSLLRVLAQVESRQDAERRHDEAHEEDHQDRAEDGREDAPLGVRLPRVLGDERPDVRGVVPRLREDPHLVRPEGPDDLRSAGAPSPARRP